MASSNTNVVAAVVTLCTKAAKSGDTEALKPSQWANKAGFAGSAASPLRRLIARVSGNGCGRNGRYREVTAAEMLELIQLGEAYQKQDGAKATATAKRVRSKLYPASKSGGRASKSTAQRSGSTRKAKASA